MAKCKNCDRKGFFLSVNKRGVCKDCAFFVDNDVENSLRIIKDSAKLVEKSAKYETKIGRCKDIITAAERLLRYEIKGIQTITPEPSIIINSYKSLLPKLIEKALKDEISKYIEKARTAVKHTSRINQLEKGIQKIAEYRIEHGDNELFDQYEKKMSELIQKVQYEELIEKADKAEFKGQSTKALDMYLDALYHLKNDDIEDAEQSKEISYLEQKIAELSK